MQKINISLLISGASGMPIFLKLLETLLLSKQCSVNLVFSKDALITFSQEIKIKLSANPEPCKEILIKEFKLPNPDHLIIYHNNDWYSPMASGSGVSDYNIVCPCSMSSLAKIANGISDTLITRSVDVAIKETKKVILVPRETPLSAIHLENMLKLARLGVCIIPPAVAFYGHPKTVDDIILFIVTKIIDQIPVITSPRLTPKWGNI
jgi:4-hydroxy-3-polyprenylbenzoate decarboxylase